MAERRLCLTLKFRDNPPGQHVAEFYAPSDDSGDGRAMAG
jgi:hypothetical protein